MRAFKSRGQHPKIDYDNNTLKYKDFIAAGAGAPEVEADFEEDACRIIVHTGGTTGLPKSVMISDQITNNVAWSYGYIGFPIKRQNVWYNELPPFIIYSMMISVHLPLFYGVTVVLNPEFSVEKFAKNFKKYKPNYAGGVTEHWRQLIRSPLMKDFDMSFLIAAVIGGIVASANEYLLLPIKSSIQKYSLNMVNKDTTLKLSKLGDKAGAIGACLLSQSKLLGLLD